MYYFDCYLQNKLRVVSLALFTACVLLTGCDRQPEEQVDTVPPSADEPAPPPQTTMERQVRELKLGDLQDIRERRLLRVLVSPSQTNYFIRKGEVRGFEAGLFQEYEKFLNQGNKDAAEQTHVVFVPKPFPDLLPALARGDDHGLLPVELPLGEPRVPRGLEHRVLLQGGPLLPAVVRPGVAGSQA